MLNARQKENLRCWVNRAESWFWRRQRRAARPGFDPEELAPVRAWGLVPSAPGT